MKQINRYIVSNIRFITLGITLVWLFMLTLVNEIPPDTGDGIMHFFISQASWTKPELFLDHWGKPLFILLSSSFAQFGFTGIICFQILVFAFTCIISFNILKKLGVNSVLISVFPFLLVLTNDYSLTVLSAMTENLFNLFCVVSLFFLVNKKWFLFALIISFMPFLRSEGQLCILIGAILLMYWKEFKYLPLLFIGFLMYSFLGIFVFDDFWWYFSKNPYHLSNDIYGHGTWYHYFLSYKNYIGNHGLFLLIICLGVFFYQKLYLKINKELFTLYFFSFSLFFGILIAHSYFWATGQNGSYGLTRIATQGVPLLFITNLYVLNQWKLNFRDVQIKFIYGIIFSILTLVLYTNKKWPIKAKGMDLQMIKCAEYISHKIQKNQHVYYHHPLLAFKLSNNPFKENQQLKFHYGHHLESQLGTSIKKGDYIVWDSHFGDVEAGMPFETISHLKELKLQRKFSTVDDNGDRVSVYVFQYLY